MTPFDPPPDRDLPPGRHEQRRAHLVRELRGAPKRGRRALRGLMIVPGLAVLGVGAAWAAGVFDGRITEPATVRCYEAPSLTAKHATAYLGNDAALRSPQAQCAPFFARGYLATGRKVPPLRACLGDGRVSVFPARDDEVCRRLDFDPLPASAYRAEITRIFRAFGLVDAEIERTLRDEDDVSDPKSCLRAPRGVARMQAALQRAGLTDFRVRAAPGARAGDCFTDVSLAEAFDGRTLEVDTGSTKFGLEPGIDLKVEIGLGPAPEPTPGVAAPRRRCDRIFAEAWRRGEVGLQGVVRCEFERPGCLTVADALRAGQRAVRRARLERWVVAVRRKPGAKGRRLAPSKAVLDPRRRQLRIELTECP